MSVTTVAVQIGNSDNRLTQFAWSRFVDALGELVNGLGVEVHFVGFSLPNAPWQNCCMVFNEAAPEDMAKFEEALAALAFVFDQDSIALTTGVTEFVEAVSA